jgi:O-antigen ligase
MSVAHRRRRTRQDARTLSAWARARFTADGVSQGALVVALVLSPLAYGSVATAWGAVWVGLLAVSVLSSLIAIGPNARLDGLPLLLMISGACLSLALLQFSTSIPGAWANAAWQELAASGIQGAEPRIAVQDGGIQSTLAAPLGAVLGFCAAYLLAIRQESSWTIVKFLVFAGVCHAIIGGIVEYAAPGNVLLESKVAYVSDVTGPFVNRNTAASYFGLCTLGAAILTFRAIRAKPLPSRRSFRATAYAISDLLLSRALLWTVIFLVLLATTFMTGSRAGGAAMIVGLLAMAMALTFRLRGSSRGAIVVVLMVFGLTFAAVELFSASLVTRVAEGFGGDGRRAVWGATLAAIQSSPWLGTGAGTFADAFPTFRPASVGYAGVWDRAHSTPLDLALTMGVPAAMAILAGWILLIASQLKGIAQSSRSYALPALGFGALTMMSVHGAVDFSLQITGFVIPFAILIGTTFGQTTRRAVLRSRGGPALRPLRTRRSEADGSL